MQNKEPGDTIYDKAHACHTQNSRLIPCDYHKHRVSCPIYATQHRATRKNGRVATLPSTSDIKELARLLEHFLPPLLKCRSAEIAEIRDVCSKILAPGGRLLSASTIVSGHPFYSEYAKIHRDCGLENIEEASELVWNPFSVETELIENFLKRENPRGFDVPLENILSVCQREK